VTSALTGVCVGGECVAPGCGNGVVEGTELCDDGNVLDGDGCAGDCSALDTCPPIGTTPQFSAVLHRAFEQDCFDYMTDEVGDRAVALCGFSDGPDMLENRVAQGEPGAPLVSVGLTSPNATAHDASLSPEGDELFVLWIDNTNSAATIRVYQLVAGTWSERGVLAMPFAIDIGVALGAPSRGIPRRMIVATSDGIAHELEISAVTATEIARPFGSTGVSRANLTPDGLRAVGVDYAMGLPFYSDRPALDAAFRPLEEPPGVPLLATATMTANCERLYFPGFDSILYLVQR
jgi:cysteine-rich repeat protein